MAEVIQKAERLDGKTIRLRGLANFGIASSKAQMWMYRDCMVKTDPNKRQGYVKGWSGTLELNPAFRVVE